MNEAHPLGPNPEADVHEFDPASPVYQVMEVLMSPKLATAILETRAPNRPIRQSDVEKYAVDMKKGHWLRNGQTIKFDRHGRLLDGQHRLWAIIEADVSIDLTVAVGLEPEAMATVDTGRSRSFSDVLAIAGTTNARTVAAVTRIIWMYETNGWQKSTSHLELGATMSRFPDLSEYAASFKAGFKNVGQGATAIFTGYMSRRVDSASSERFMSGLLSGSGLEQGEPVLALRERLISWRAERTAPPADHVAMLFIKAWNHHLAGREIQKLQWQPSRESRIVFNPPVPGLRQPAPDRRIPDKE